MDRGARRDTGGNFSAECGYIRKHDLENDTGEYLPREPFILAALTRGCDYRFGADGQARASPVRVICRGTMHKLVVVDGNLFRFKIKRHRDIFAELTFFALERQNGIGIRRPGTLK